MNGDVDMRGTENHAVFTTRNILRILTMVMLIFAFCPSFLVSCSDIDKEYQISAWTAIHGVDVSEVGEVMEPLPFMIFCFLLPAAVGVLLCIKSLREQVCAGGVLGCTAADMMLWFYLRDTIKSVAQENMCQFKTLWCFYVDMAVMCAVMVLALLVAAGVLRLDKSTVGVYGGGTRMPPNGGIKDGEGDGGREEIKDEPAGDVDGSGRLKIRMAGYTTPKDTDEAGEVKHFKQAVNLDGTSIREKERARHL